MLMQSILELIALTFALAIYTAAFIAEIVRTGILAIHKGQREAAESIGLKPNKVMKLVILPQARRVIIPPLTSQYLNLTKNSSLAIAIGYMDLVATLELQLSPYNLSLWPMKSFLLGLDTDLSKVE